MWLPMKPAPPVTTAVRCTRMSPSTLSVALRVVASPRRVLLSADPLHGADVVVPGVVEAVGQQLIAEGAGEVADGVLDRALRLEAEHAVHLVGVHVVRAVVVGRSRRDLD